MFLTFIPRIKSHKMSPHTWRFCSTIYYIAPCVTTPSAADTVIVWMSAVSLSLLIIDLPRPVGCSSHNQQHAPQYRGLQLFLLHHTREGSIFSCLAPRSLTPMLCSPLTIALLFYKFRSTIISRLNIRFRNRFSSLGNVFMFSLRI